MKVLLKITSFLLIPLLLTTFIINQKRNYSSFEVRAETQEEKLERLKNEIDQYEQELQRLRSEARTLSNQIAQYDAQIRLALLKISETEEKIILLGGRIEQLETSLQALETAFSSRVVKTYKMARFNQPLLMLISSPDLSSAVSGFHYLKKIQEADRSLMIRLGEAQGIYREEKTDQEDLQEELEGQKIQLDNQKASKAKLLEITRNDEKQYQALLAKARAEFEAIQAILAGKGEETEVGTVSEGDRIASVIGGASVCSTGAHLHFEVAKDGINHNPASLLSDKSVQWDNAPDGPFSFTGSWSWPMVDPIRITQGYGMTYYASQLNYYGGSPHSGVDMINDSNHSVKAVKPGTLYRGSIPCGGGTLRYVRVKHNVDGYDTYYLHINY